MLCKKEEQCRKKNVLDELLKKFLFMHKPDGLTNEICNNKLFNRIRIKNE